MIGKELGESFTTQQRSSGDGEAMTEQAAKSPIDNPDRAQVPSQLRHFYPKTAQISTMRFKFPLTASVFDDFNSLYM
jgi:hypothetical protein